MDQTSRSGGNEIAFLDGLARSTSRRRFLQWSGLTIAVAAVGCSGDDNTGPGTGGGAVNLGTGDTAILNYAYALEQLEAAFYVQVATSFYSGATASEQAILTDIRDHEVIHREFLKAALGAAAIGALSVNFTSIDFTSRASVLGAAKAFEDLGVSAYNGAGKLLTNPDYLVVAGKIVSVEARHAATIRDLLAPKTASFAGGDVVDANGLDVVNTPATVLDASHAGAYVTTTIDASGIPTA
ncbi:MAG: ferritin-like domain-containing protein [Gemmatimonadales bacterium]|nr:ferritin-like domain-containing protein [Gemmatimonadales bacterium]